MYLNNDLTNNKNKIKEDILLLDNQYFFELIFFKKTKTKELTIENIRFEMYNDKRIYIMIEN